MPDRAARVAAALRWLPADGSERVGADRDVAQALRTARARGWAERRYARGEAYARWRLTEAGRAMLREPRNA